MVSNKEDETKGVPQTWPSEDKIVSLCSAQPKQHEGKTLFTKIII